VIGAIFGDYAGMRTVRYLAVWVCLCLGGCHRGSDEAGAAKPVTTHKLAAPVKKGPTVQEQTAGLVEAASPGKSDAPIELKFDLQHRPTLGKALEIGIAIIPQISARVADVQASGSEGLSVATASADMEISPVEAMQVYRRVISVTPSAEGLMLLGVKVTLKHDEVEDYRVFSIPLIVSPK